MIINRIRLNYNIKLLDDYFQQKDYENVVKLFQSQEKSPIYYNLAQYAVNKYLTQQNYYDFAPSKFVWISSFDLEDISYLKNFLEFYLPKTLNQSSLVDDYKSIFSSTFENLNIKNFPSRMPWGTDYTSVVGPRMDVTWLNYLNLFVTQQVRSGRYQELWGKFVGGEAPELRIPGVYY